MVKSLYMVKHTEVRSMEDKQIIALYWSRNEDAIRQTESRYGGRLNALAYRIVNTREDAQECVSDTYLAAWDSMPPQWPEDISYIWL